MSKITTKQLTFDQQQKLLLTPCRNRQELKNWIRYHLSLELPDVTVSRFSDTNPLDVIWAVYQICVLKHNPDNIQELLFVAGRGSGKTLGMAIAELMIILHDQRGVVHVGAIQNQADRCYNYQKNFLYNRKLKPVVMPPGTPEDQRILEKANMSKSIFNVNGEKITLEVLPCTLKSVNGPHEPLVVVDEIDTVAGEGLVAFKDIGGMLDSRRGKKALRVGISTRKSRYGLMNRKIEEMEANPDKTRQVRRWTAFEFTERCPDSRSGTNKIDLYVNQDKMEVLSVEEFKKKDKLKQKEYTLHQGFEGCYKCPLFSVCLTDAKKQNSISPMLKTLDEMIQKVRSEGADWALAQLMNLKPSVEGIIFREFDEKIHIKNWNEMWKVLVGKEFPGECTHDLFVKKCHEMNIPCYAGIDWGFTSPNTVVFFFVDGRDNIYVVRTDGMTHISNPTWMQHIKTKYHTLYKCQMYIPDAADQGNILEMQKIGLPVANQKDKGQINVGIQVIKKFLKVPGSTDTKIYLARDFCNPLVREFGLYHYKMNTDGLITDDPDKEHDHWIDAFRYAMTLLFGKSTVVLGSGLVEGATNLQDPQGNFHRMPTISEFAVAHGIRMNDQEPDRSKLGKIGKASELDEPGDDDDSTGGSGGFLWSL